jgi:hypothetical protein
MRLGSIGANEKGQKIMKKRTATKRPQLKRWALKTGKMIARTGIAALEAQEYLLFRL